LDSDDSGYISAENLAEMLGDEFPNKEIDEIIKEADLTKDHRISYPEFLALWESHSEDKRNHLYKDIQPSLTSISSLGGDTDSEDFQLSYRSVKSDMEEEDLVESNILARANFIEGEHVSERKHKKVLAIGH